MALEYVTPEPNGCYSRKLTGVWVEVVEVFLLGAEESEEDCTLPAPVVGAVESGVAILVWGEGVFLLLVVVGVEEAGILLLK